MIRRIIKIDQELCNGCGLCAKACHEGAIAMVNGKATLTREDYCDGLGDCLPVCPVNAISFEEREAPAYNEAAVKAAMANKGGGCPGSKSVTLMPGGDSVNCNSMLSQWPVQIKLVPVTAPYFENADILIAADCTAFAYGSLHNDFIKGRVTLIGCPKLDSIDYSEKISAIFAGNNIKSITVVRMEVPCCGGIEYAVKNAVETSGRDIPVKVYTVSVDGKLI